MGELRFKESYPGSGVTKDGTRINPNMPDYGKLPFVIKKEERAKATWEDPRFQRIVELSRRMDIALGNRFQRNSSLFRKICFSIKLECEIPKVVVKPSLI